MSLLAILSLLVLSGKALAQTTDVIIPEVFDEVFDITRNKMWVLTLALGLLSFLLFSYYRKRTKQVRVLKSLGIPGPEPHWLWGNLKDLDQENMHGVYQEWTKKYGKVFGYYEGPLPIIVSADPDFLKQVFVKEFSKFHGRKCFPIQADPDDASTGVHMFSARGNRWKRLRTIINPTFSSSKLKQTLPVVNKKVGIMLQKLSEAALNEKPFNVQGYFERLTLDVIGEAAFGMDVDPQNNQKEPFLKRCRQIFKNIQKRPITMKIAVIFPGVRYQAYNLFRLLSTLIDSPHIWLVKNIGKIVEMRRKEEGKRQDLLQMMLDAEADISDKGNLAMSVLDEEDNNSSINNEQVQDRNATKGKNTTGDLDNNYQTTGERKLTNREIMLQGFLFMVAGYETTSTTLGFCSYLLATNPDKQRLLQEEVDQNLALGGEPTYDQLQAMPYLEMVLTETLRMYPLGSLVVNRLCMETCNVQGYTIPEGTAVQADVWSLHYNPELWGPVDPHKFEPERCSKENMRARHQMAWIPFGAGPRNCIGLRFAYMEAKVAIARMVRHFEFRQCNETQVPLQVREVQVLQPKDGVTIILSKRSN